MRSVSKIILALAFFAVLSMPGHAQQQPSSGSAPAAEPLGENDPIPFMRDDKQSRSDEPSSAGILFKTFGSLAVIVGLVFAGAWGAKKLGYGNVKPVEGSGTQLSVLTSVSLGNGRTVSTIRFGERTLLVGSTPQSFTLLAEEDAETANVTAAAPRSVADMLAEDASNFRSELSHAESRLNTFIPGSKAS